MKLLEAKIEGLALDMTTNSPVVILAPLNIEKVLPIWIGHAEAWGIAMELSGTKPPRPMTYDLLKAIVDRLNATVSKIEITELKEQTFYARLYVKSNGEEIQLYPRPSDYIALALKFGKPVILFNFDVKDLFLPRAPDARIFNADTPESVIDRIRSLLEE